MSQSSLRWRVAAVIPALALFVAATPSATKGITYDFSMVTTNDAGKGKDMTMTGKGMVAGGNARIEFTDVNMPQMRAQGGPFAEGSYILFKGATKEFIVVDTKQKQYAEMNQDGLMQLTSALTNIVKFEMSNVHVDANRVQPDTTVDGYKTMHYRLTQAYHMKMSVAFIHHENDVNSSMDYYYAPQFDDLINPYLSSGWSSSSNFFNNADYTSQLKAATAKLHHGVPVMVVMHSTHTDKKGKTESGTTIMHTTNLVRGDVPASMFEIPAGYTKYEPPAAAPDASAQNAQSGNAQGDTAATKKKKKGLFHFP
ncbi:MAG: hypothetical protein JJD97_05010 [Gemmatimonadaceae bacterium]|nr:hypothetical protein [Gemmatimonadaceae bacterium]